MPDGMTTNENRRSRSHLGRPWPHDLRFGVNLIGGALITALIMLGSAEASSPGSEALSVRALGAVFNVSQPYGAVNKEVNATPGGVHAGIDFLAQHGTAVRAVRDGTVIKAGGPYGTVAVFDGQNTVLYIHMQDIDVSKLNERITVGTFLGTVGRVGATGVHLHIEVRKGRYEVGVGCTKEDYQKTPGKGLVPSPTGWCESSRRVADLTIDPVGYLVGAQEVAAPGGQPPASRPGAPVASTSVAPPQTDVPVPEFFGVYLVSDGKLLELKDAKSENRLKMVGLSIGISKLSGVTASPRSYVIVYGKDLSQIVYFLMLGRFEYFKTVTTAPNDPFAFGRQLRTFDARMWIPKEEIPVKPGPVKGQQDLFRVVPTRPLPDGVYAFYLGSLKLDLPVPVPMALTAIGAVLDFAVGAGAQTARAPEPSAPVQPPPPTPSPAPSPGPAPRGQEAPPARPTIAALTRDIPDAAAFREQERVFAAAFDDVWGAAQRALSRTSLLKRQADRIVTMDRDNGVLVTAPTTHSRLLGESFRRQLAILIERVTATTTRVTVKGLCYDQKGMNTWTRWDPDRCSDHFIQELEKALAEASKR